MIARYGVGPLQFAVVTVCWLFALGLAWRLAHPDAAKLADQGNALWMDGHAYWSMWRHPTVYGAAPRAIDAYLYSPAFAEALWPLTVPPFVCFAIAWWAVIIVAFVWLLHPLPWFWRAPAFVLTGYELQVGNVHALLAVMVVLGLRWPTTWSFALLTKVTPAVGLLWFAARGDWHSLARVGAFTGLVVAVSAAASPQLWVEWLSFLVQSRHSPAAHGLLNAGTLVPRLACAAFLVIWGARRDPPWVLAIAVPLATPLMGLATLTVLAALPRLALVPRPRHPPATASHRAN